MTCAVVFVDLPCECSLVVVSFLLLCALTACCCSCFLLLFFFLGLAFLVVVVRLVVRDGRGSGDPSVIFVWCVCERRNA